MPLFSLNPKESPRELFGREREMKELISLVRERRWTAILGPRMVGKTSIIKASNKRLEGMNVRTIYVNLWGVKGVNGLLNALAHGINEDRNIWNKIKDFAKRIEGISFGPGGITISISRKPVTTLLDLFSALGRQSEDYVIELDEAQELSAISGHLLKLLARIFNTYPNIIFIFTGSMFEDPPRTQIRITPLRQVPSQAIPPTIPRGDRSPVPKEGVPRVPDPLQGELDKRGNR